MELVSLITQIQIYSLSCILLSHIPLPLPTKDSAFSSFIFKGVRDLDCLVLPEPVLYHVLSCDSAGLLLASSLMNQCWPLRCTYMVLHSILGDGMLIEAFKC